MKKTLSIFILGMIFISMGASIVSATGIVEEIQGGIKGTYDIFKPTIEAILGGTSGTEFFLAKILFLIVVFAVVWKGLERIAFFKESSWVLWIVSIAVSILSVRWLENSELIKTVLLPYSVLGIALTAGIPFVIYFFITLGLNKTMRKISWVFFIVIFVTMWIMRSKELGGFQYIYLATAGLGLAVLAFDGTIHKIKQKIDAEKGMSYKELERKHRIMDDLDEARDIMAKIIARGGNASELGHAKAHIKLLEKELAALP